ncbi:MAG TPA: AMP-binding protein [Solirubrobacterales bacterium]|nr:AMP-binding protein [Solirubrobacterales bacterium]
MSAPEAHLEVRRDGRGSEEPRPLPPDGPRWHSGYREAADDEMPVAGMTLGAVLARRVRERPDATYLVFEDSGGDVLELTYAEFADRVEALAGGLAALGVGRGDRVLMQLPNCPELVTAMFAVARLGAIFVPSNTANRISELAHLIATTEPVLVMTVGEHRGAVAGALAEAGSAARVVTCRDETEAGEVPYAALAAGRVPVDAAEVAATDPLQIMFSSGTTSRPKGVVATHTNLLTSGRRQAMSYRAEPEDRFLTVLPLFHASAQSTTLFAALVSGAMAIFLERYSASRFWGQVRAHGTTRLTLVAMLLRTLVAQRPSAADADHRIRSIGYATNMAEDAQRAFEERFGARLTNAYGLTEAMTEVTIAPVDGPRHWPSVGLPTMDREVRIVDADGAELPAGEIGEIQIHGVPGETIMKEYWGNPEATARALVDGWLRTSDMGWKDEDGYLFFADRDIDLIKTAGENVSASEVEETLRKHAAVDEAVVFGVPDPVRDEVVKAVIVPVAGAAPGEEEILDFCREQLARFKVPAVLEFRDELPTNAVGKVDKKLLKGPA